MKQKISLIIITGFLFQGIISAQTTKNNSYNVGVDPITQGFYVGFDHAIHDYSIGVDVGLGVFMPLNVSLCVDNAFYFGKVNKYDHKTWHVNGRIAYSKILVDNKPNMLFIIPSFGKTFCLNEKLGINVELGYGFQVLDDWGSSLMGGTSYYFKGVSSPNIRIEFKY
jgi:hypothetical protein